MGKRGKRKQMDTAGDVIETRSVPNPHVSWAQFLHEIEEGKPDPGITKATVNVSTLMGGFARFYGTEAQQKACAEFRSLWERSQVGGAKAIDPSREPVDGGWINPEAVFEIGADARKRYNHFAEYMGRVDLARLHFVVIGEWGPTSYARWRWKLRNPNSRAVADAKVEVRRLADRAAVFFELMGY